jgi:cold shock protein
VYVLAFPNVPIASPANICSTRRGALRLVLFPVRVHSPRATAPEEAPIRPASRVPGPDTSRLDVFAFLAPVRRIIRKGTIMTIGTVKFFNSSKGFGFISPEGGAKDVFVHATALEAAGMTSLSEGQKVSFDIQPDAKGSKAVNLRNA